eukprot:CAMPEP_0203679032 /NCGR_PEP_ID=MMETSP0090-20130426/34080_1 /ASSEMBLY_ACC=CAM_ASM_001088 /TAXON_ID=426623 /ORGANISM="Chaetoceros affinis, Strain CCMP159" /LENGTH=87 /DNA_ID=CAMNT_0050546523 /DNA_START=9 /DNA_END=268 /DNA_ORIENTATION=-
MKEIIQRMHNAPIEWNISPDTFTYNSLLYAYSKSSFHKAAKDCESILQHMKKLEKQEGQTVIVDTISYNIVLDSWAQSNDKKGPDRG